MAAFERKLAERLDRLEREIRRLLEAYGSQQDEIEHLRHEVKRIEHEHRPHHYPALSGITVTPL